MTRALQAADMEEVALLFTRLNLQGQPPSWADFSKPHVVALGLEEGKGLLGYAEGWTAGPEGNLNAIVVRSDLEGKGLASKLLAAFEKAMAEKNCQEIHLEVKSQNQRAIHLYLKHGFRQTGERKNYYSDGDSALLMKKALDD